MADFIETALRAALKGDATLGDLVGGPGAASRVFFEVAPQGTELPYVVLERVSAPPHHVLKGKSGAEESHWQIDVYAAEKGERKAVAEAVKDLFDTHQGVLEGISVLGILLEGEADGFIREQDGSDGGRFHTRLDFAVHSLR